MPSPAEPMFIPITQQNHFAKRAWTDFCARVTGDVLRAWPAECRRVDGRAIALTVERAGSRALELGFTSHNDVARFIHLVFAFEDSDFHRLPAMAEAMARGDIPAPEKMALLWQIASVRLASPE